MNDLKPEIEERVAYIDELILKALPPEEGFQKTVFSAMKYSMMAGGKRMRPLLMQSTFEFFGGRDEELLGSFMTAIEMIHTYSLIHDDLPAMDNDDFRRGKPTSHKVYGEAMAILAGDALLNYAYEISSAAVDRVFAVVHQKNMAGEPVDKETSDKLMRAVRSLKILGEMPGANGMLGGQVVDVELTAKAIPGDTLKFIYDYKTGAMIEASMMIGACLAGAPNEQIDQIKRAAHNIGMAFQIQDDILDVTGTQEEIGKPVHSDERNLKTTWVSLYGIDKAREDEKSYTDSALGILSSMYGEEYAKVTFLYRFVSWLTGRTY